MLGLLLRVLPLRVVGVVNAISNAEYVLFFGEIACKIKKLKKEGYGSFPSEINASSSCVTNTVAITFCNALLTTIALL